MKPVIEEYVIDLESHVKHLENLVKAEYDLNTFYRITIKNKEAEILKLQNKIAFQEKMLTTLKNKDETSKDS